MLRMLRYLAPNLVTSLAMLFGLASLVATYEHRFVDAGWLIIWAVLLDRVDGLVARSLKATSEFGLQMDSFADAFNFGVAPAFLMYISLSEVSTLGFASGGGRVVLMVACASWVLANVFRLAKFNVVSESATKPGANVFFGVPTTLAAGVLVIWYLTLHKYAPTGAVLGQPEAFVGPKLFGTWTIGMRVWGYIPPAMLLFAVLMVSNLPCPKLGRLKSKTLTGIVVVLVLIGYGCGFGRFMPDFMMLMPTSWVLVALMWGLFSVPARSLRPPPIFPTPPPGPDEDDDVGDASVVRGS